MRAFQAIETDGDNETMMMLLYLQTGSLSPNQIYNNGDVHEQITKQLQLSSFGFGLRSPPFKLTILSEYLIPTFIKDLHGMPTLTVLMHNHVREWHNAEGTANFTCGGAMLTLPIQLYEFLPGPALRYQYHYVSPPTNEMPVQSNQMLVQTRIPSVPIAMKLIDNETVKKCDIYINNIVDNYIKEFGELCWRGGGNEFQEELFALVTSVKLGSYQEQAFIREVYRLIVVTYIMGRTLTIVNAIGLQSVTEHPPKHTTSRLATRQLKLAFFHLQNVITTNVLRKLEQVLDSSRSCNDWLIVFIAVIGICIANEDRQTTIHFIQKTRVAAEDLDQRTCEANATSACEVIDCVTLSIMCVCLTYMGDIMQNTAYRQDSKALLEFVHQVHQLVQTNSKLYTV